MMSTAPHTPPPHPAGLNCSEHIEARLPARLQGSSGAHKPAMSNMTPPDPRLGHVADTTYGSSNISDIPHEEPMWRSSEVAASSTAERYEAAQKPFVGMPTIALQPPPPFSMRHSTAAPFSSSPVQLSSLGDCAGDGTSNHSSSSSSSHSASHTSSHYLLAIQRDLESIVRLQQLQLQERRVSLPSEASTTGSVPRVWIDSEVVAAPSATGVPYHITATVDSADSAMHLQSIDHAKQSWFEGNAAAHAPPHQQQSPQPLPLSYHPRLTVAPAGAHAAKASDAAPQLSLDPWQSSLQGDNDMLLSPSPHVVSGASISAGAGGFVMHQQQQPQPPPPPPSSSPIPASLVEYQRYLMQLEHQQRQHREVLRRHRRQRKEEMMAAAQRGATMITVPVSMTTPPRQRTGVGAATEDRRDRSPPLAMMKQTLRQRRGDGRGIRSVDTLCGNASSSASSKTAPSVTQQRGRHSQKQWHTTTPSPAPAAEAQSRDRSGGRRASSSRGRGCGAEDAGPSAARGAGIPAVALRDAPARNEHRQSTPKQEQRRKSNMRNSPTNSRSRYVSPQRLATAVVNGRDVQHLLLHTPPLIAGSLPRSFLLASGLTDATPLQVYAETATLTPPQSSSPVEAFADALLMDVNGALGTVGDGASAVGSLPPPPPPLMTTHSFAGTAITRETTPFTAVGGTATVPAPIVFAIAPSGAVVMPPGDVADDHRDEAEMAPAAEQKFWHHRSRDQHQGTSRESNLTTMTTTTPASSTESSPSRERGAHTARAVGGARMHVKGGAATPAAMQPSAAIAAILQHPDATATAHSHRQQRSRSADPILVHGNNGFNWRLTRRRVRGAGATTTEAETHHNYPDVHRKTRHHLHNGHHHRSVEGISSTTPEHGTGTPRSSRYRYNSSSTTRQRKQSRQLSKHTPHNADGADTRSDGHDGSMKHTVDAARQPPASPGGGDKAHGRAMPGYGNRNATTAAATPSYSCPAGGDAVSRLAHLRPLPPSRKAAAIWHDVKLMWTPVPASQTPFAAVYRYHPHTHPPTSFHGQQQQSLVHRDVSPSASAGRTAEIARGHTTGRASAAAVRSRGASRALTGAAGASPSAQPPPSIVLPHTQQQMASAGAPLLCMTDSLIGAALRDVLPVCRARQREVAREVARRRYQTLPAGVGAATASATVL
ncbi:conserved hypothetical protein [Leishmania major strain Friedlin]|uniref:Uncharacterized protein n=1 Tax=Leishmania major TaxID=5664 RepID=Q4QHC6_LEIMA|nr:conserved hypothetical protein [Leishmania major strain Friedlin]CAG9570069.1 hypothetical_protein_-_conserved [Leishmania major strain Friedlin]CAJ02845.1 conserved hypothetical protein [Leishmania major strain Friedlin]|eukprot:XP_001681422.1 conserved hypothetical protein [Leishmania major strain Friedlin]